MAHDPTDAFTTQAQPSSSDRPTTETLFGLISEHSHGVQDSGKAAGAGAASSSSRPFPTKTRLLACVLVALWAPLSYAPGGQAAEASIGVSASPLPSSPGAILESAFINRYSVDLVTRIELLMHGRGNQKRERTIAAVTKVVDGRVYSIGRLLSPEYLRDMTVLMMENEKRGQDAFIFMPSLDKVRRISTAQRSDAFFGSDVTYEDIEQQRATDFEFESMESSQVDGEAIYEIHARPARLGNYERVIFTVAKDDFALLNIRYFKRGAEDPYRVIDAPREFMTELDGHVLPTRLSVENRIRGTRTDVLLSKMSTSIPIPNRIFSVRTLESKAPLPQAP